MAERPPFERDLARLIGACEAGLDLPGVLSAAAAAIAAALGASATAVYSLSEDGGALTRLQGEGPDTLDPPSLEPESSDGGALLPLVSARRMLGCIVAEGVTDPAGLTRARIAAGVAAQAVEASRLWESAGGGAGTLDLLTGLPNHLGFQSVLGRELARAKRTGLHLAVSLVDLDGLAEFNRRHGAAEGDRVLRLAAECLARGVRSYDCVCRLDEDEFALVLPGMTAESAAILVGRLSDTFGSWSLGERRMTVSGGVAAFPDHGATTDELVRLAHGGLGRRSAGG
jgi:diguanylate cyclase (GGDEF)-like protein